MLCCRCIAAVVFLPLTFAPAFAGAPPAARDVPQAGSVSPSTRCAQDASGSPYIPVDDWVYSAVLRLYSLGFVDHPYLDMRPWTRASLSNMLQDSGDLISDADQGPATEEARQIYDAVNRELQLGAQGACIRNFGLVHLESTYSVLRGISGTPLRDSFHLGSTIVNDYGRPYENGLNDYSGASGYAIAGPFTLYVRGEFEGAPSAAGYPQALAQALSVVDGTIYTDPTTQVTSYFLPQATIPEGPIGTTARGRFLEAYISAQVLNHVISFGKQDEWLGPAQGGSMAYSNNAENIYAFHINRIEPLDIPGLSRITGPFRYEFLIGELGGHTLMPNPLWDNNPSAQPNVINPGNPWVHVEKLSFHPTENIEFGFERTALFGGKGHSPVTLHTFIRSFFSAVNVNQTVKDGPDDPGARFGAFDFSYRLPFLRNWLTLYTDSEVHDDVNPISAPRRSAYRPGIYLSHVPGLPKLDLRVEAASTDPATIDAGTSQYGRFMYWEVIEKQAYTNRGQLFGDWIGREDKGGQAWVTYHLSGNEWVQLGWRNQKATKDFIPGSPTQTSPGSAALVAGGTTLNDLNVQVMKRIGKEFEINGNFTSEHWKAPVYLPGQQTVTAMTVQFTWFPDRFNQF